MSTLARRRKAVVVVLTILSAVLVVKVVSDLFEVSLLDRMARGDDVSASDADANDTRQGIINLARFLLVVVTAVLFIRWFSYGYRQLDPSLRRWDTSWAIGGWFVPVLAWWRPKQIVNDIWNAGGSRVPSLLLNAWWTTWVLANTIRVWMYFVSRTDDTVSQVRDTAIRNTVSETLSCVAAVLAILVVRAVTRRVELAHRPIPAAQWTSPERPAGVVA